MRILVRLACCAYLVFYVIIPMLKPQAGEDTMNPALKIVFVAAFIVAVIVIMTLTVREVITNLKKGYYKAEAYTDDPGVGVAAGIAGDAGEEEEAEDEAEDDEDDEGDYEDDEGDYDDDEGDDDEED